MRYKLSELATLPVVGKFTTLDTVTISIYDLSDGSVIALDSNECSEIGVTGYFTWDFSNLTDQPTEFTRYLWIMSNGSIEVSGQVDAGGWVESIPDLPPVADTCKITVNLSEADGKVSFPDDLFSPNYQNHIKLGANFYGNSRYYRLGEYKPSFDSLTGQAFWVLPQGATVDVILESYGIESKGAVVPASATVDLYAWLNS